MGKMFNNLFEDMGGYYLMYDKNNNFCIIDKQDYDKVVQGYWGKHKNCNYFASTINGKK